MVCSSHVLMKRAKIIDETEAMRQQNTELRSLLQQYINAQVASFSSSSRAGVGLGVYLCGFVSQFANQLMALIIDQTVLVG